MIFRHFEPSFFPSGAILLIVVPALLSGSLSRTVRLPFAALPLAFAAYWSGLAFFTLTYRLSSFHPLAKYPGPLLAKTSKWWAAYLGGTGDQHRYRKRLHDSYGDVVRIGWHLRPLIDISSLTRLQVPMSSPFAMLPLSMPYSARVVCEKDHVCTHHLLYRSTCPLVMVRLGWGPWGPFSNWSARSREAHAATQTMESRVFVHGIERIRSYYGKAGQTTY